MSRATVVRILALTLLIVGAACSDDPDGPGTVDLVIRAPVPLGAAVVELVGEGIQGMEQPAQGWSELVPLAPDGTTPVHRVVVIQEEPGQLTVRLRVTDVQDVRPVTTVVEATDAADEPVTPLSQVEVVIRR